MNNRHRMIVKAKKRYGFYPYVRVNLNVENELTKALREVAAKLTDYLRELMLSANEAARAFDWSGIAKQLGGKP